MTTALSRAINQSRAFKTTAYDRGANYLIGDKGFDFSVGPATQFDSFHNNYRDKKRYSQYSCWFHADINAIAKKGAGQAVNLGRFGDEVTSPKPTKHYLSKHMSNDLRAKAAEREVEIIFDHPLRKALDNPNDLQGRWQFVYSFIVNLNLTGWSFVVVDTDGDIPKFYSLPTTWVKPVHKDAPFSHFKIVNPEDPAAYHDAELLDRTQVTFAYIPNPANPFQALAPAQAQNMAIGIDEHIQQSQNVFFHNGIFPSIIITVAAMPGGVPGAPVTRPKLSGAQRRQIYAAVRKLSGGVANYGNPAIVDGLIEKFEKLSMDSNEMGWEKSEKAIRSRILSAFGVHPFILGEETAASYAQSWNVKDIFFENVNSYLDMLGSCMTHFVHGITGDEGLMCWWDAAVPIDPGLEHSIYEGARKRGDVSQNEFRAWMGLPPDLDRNEDVLGNNSTNATTIAVRTAEGRLDIKQAKALLEAMGVPSSKAKEIAGKGPPPGTVPPGQQPPGLPQPQGNLTPEQQQQQETRGRKPEAEEEIEQDIKKAIEALRQPIVIEMKAIEDHSEKIVETCCPH